MRAILNVAVIIFAFWISISAFAQAKRTSHPDETVIIFGPSGNELLNKCNDVGRVKPGDVLQPSELISTATNTGLCSGFIAAVSDTLTGEEVANNRRTYCLPSGVELEQLVRVVRKYLEDNPTVLHFPSEPLVKRALVEGFPCHLKVGQGD